MCLSVQLPLPVQVPIQLLLELEANWLDQNVHELEFELSRMQMKWSLVSLAEHIFFLFNLDKRSFFYRLRHTVYG
jgi:hypothetical protein